MFRKITEFKKRNIPKWVLIAVGAVVLILVIKAAMSFGAGDVDSSYSTGTNSGGTSASVSASSTPAPEEADEVYELPEKSDAKTASGSSTSAPVATPTPVNNNTLTLPDPGVFLQCAVGENQTSGDGGRLLSYYFSKDSGEGPAKEFIELLKNRYPLELANHQYEDWISTSAMDKDSYVFNYAGNSKVNSVTDWEGTYDVKVCVLKYYVVLLYFPSITVRTLQLRITERGLLLFQKITTVG